MGLKSLENIFDEVKSIVNPDSLPIVIWDTSAIIDLCASARNGRNGKTQKRDQTFLRKNYSDHFLMAFGGEFQSLIPDNTYVELKKHYGYKINSHVFEIDNGVRSLLKKFHEDYWRFKGENFQYFPEVDNELSEVLKNCRFSGKQKKTDKKKKEGFSYVDFSILKDAIHFSRYFKVSGYEIGPVIILSSDSHILSGVRQLNKIGYGNIKAISLRRQK